MQDFEVYLDDGRIDEIQTFLEQRNLDQLRTIAKRFGIAASTLQKKLIVSKILQAVDRKVPYAGEPPIHQMTMAQLRNKSRDLNLSYTPSMSKQVLRQRILQTMSSTSSSSSTSGTNSDMEGQMAGLASKSLVQLKIIAKNLKIKISNKSKSQLVTLILEKQSSSPSSSLTTTTAQASSNTTSKDITKMSKNELIVLAEERGLPFKGKTKEDLIRMIRSGSGEGEEGGGVQTTTTPTRRRRSTTSFEKYDTEITTLPLSVQMEKAMLEDRTITIPQIKTLIKKFNVTLPSKLKKREELLRWMTTVSSSKNAQQNTNQTETETEKQTSTKPREDARRRSSAVQIVRSSAIQSPTDRRRKPKGSDVVSLDDIRAPFSPVPLDDLLNEATPEQLQMELARCLQFY